jgi:hypothetical protein
MLLQKAQDAAVNLIEFASVQSSFPIYQFDEILLCKQGFAGGIFAILFYAVKPTLLLVNGEFAWVSKATAAHTRCNALIKQDQVGTTLFPLFILLKN